MLKTVLFNSEWKEVQSYLLFLLLLFRIIIIWNYCGNVSSSFFGKLIAKSLLNWLLFSFLKNFFLIFIFTLFYFTILY